MVWAWKHGNTSRLDLPTFNDISLNMNKWVLKMHLWNNNWRIVRSWYVNRKKIHVYLGRNWLNLWNFFSRSSTSTSIDLIYIVYGMLRVWLKAWSQEQCVSTSTIKKCWSVSYKTYFESFLMTFMYIKSVKQRARTIVVNLFWEFPVFWWWMYVILIIKCAPIVCL